VVPTVVHGFAVVKLPGPLSIVKLICVPASALVAPVRIADAVRAVRRDLDVRVDDLQRLARAVGRGVERVRRIAAVAGLEPVEAGRERALREPGRVDRAGRVERDRCRRRVGAPVQVCS
jgi:hypothetical protein